MGFNDGFARTAAKLKRYGRRFIQAIVRPQQRAQASQRQAEARQAAAASTPALPVAHGNSGTFQRHFGSQPNLLRQAVPSPDSTRLPTPDLSSISDPHLAQNSAVPVRSSTPTGSELSYASSLQVAQSTAAPRPGTPTESVLSDASSLHVAQPAAGIVTQPVAPPQPPSAPLQTPAPQTQRPPDISRRILSAQEQQEISAEFERSEELARQVPPTQGLTSPPPEEPARQAPPTQGLTPAPRTLSRTTSTPRMARPERPSGPRVPAHSSTVPTSPQPQLTSRSEKRNTFGSKQAPGRKSPSPSL